MGPQVTCANLPALQGTTKGIVRVLQDFQSMANDVGIDGVDGHHGPLTYLCSGEAGPENLHFSPACLWAHTTCCHLVCNLGILNLSLTLGHRVFLADPHSLLLQQNMRAMNSR